jgi:nicotinamidase-related amidase
MAHTALLVIDIQTGFIEGQFMVHEAAQLLGRVQGLIAKAEAAGVPVIYVQHSSDLEYDGPLHPAIAPASDERVVYKMTPDSFHETDLGAKLQALGIQQVVMAGLQSEMCINATARQAHQLGYGVVIVEDAHSTMDSETQTAPEIIAAHNQQFASFARLVTAESLAFNGLN